jgi:tRNA (adenine57-N1/adenine58-N1)-methyltransferase
MKRGPTPIYPQEAASVPYLLDLGLGDKVLEAGTGSGNKEKKKQYFLLKGGLTLFLSRAVGHTGKIDTFEMREDFHAIAKRNVENWWRGTNNVNFHIGNLSEISLPEEHYDGVVLVCFCGNLE